MMNETKAVMAMRTKALETGAVLPVLACHAVVLSMNELGYLRRRVLERTANNSRKTADIMQAANVAARLVRLMASCELPAMSTVKAAVQLDMQWLLKAIEGHKRVSPRAMRAARRLVM